MNVADNVRGEERGNIVLSLIRDVVVFLSCQFREDGFLTPYLFKPTLYSTG